MKHTIQKQTRRQCLAALGAAACSLALPGNGSAQQIAPKKRPNVLLIVADDMGWDTPGCFGGAAPDVTPNLDRLAAEGMKFTQAYNNIAICTPARAVMLTGLYPHNNGTEGFQRINPGTPNLPAQLNAAGYLCGIVGKPLRQQDLLRWSVTYRWQGTGDENLWGRDPGMYRQFTNTFLQMVKDSQQPFFLMANSHDPHPPYDDDDHGHPLAEFAPSSRVYKPEEVIVPGFMPDLPEVREELAGYCTSARRFDDTVGAILDELDAAGMADDTIVIFLSDNGIALPGAKTNCSPEGTHTPLIVRWPGHVQKDTADHHHMISAIDLYPTILEALEMPLPPSLDGRSFLPLLKGEKQSNRDAVYTEFHHIHGKNATPMRSLITRDHAYIFNAWPDGKRRFHGAGMGNDSWDAMHEAAKTDPAIAARIHYLLYRTVEEFYDLKSDPLCLTNLLDDDKRDKITPELNEHLQHLQKEMRDTMVKSEDHILPAFDNRTSPEALEQWMQDYSAKAIQDKVDLIPYEKANNFRF